MAVRATGAAGAAGAAGAVGSGKRQTSPRCWRGCRGRRSAACGSPPRSAAELQGNGLATARPDALIRIRRQPQLYATKHGATQRSTKHVRT